MQSATTPSKKPSLAIELGLLVGLLGAWGVGHIYEGKVAKGIGWMTGGFSHVGAILIVLVYALGPIARQYNLQALSESSLVTIFALIIGGAVLWMALWIYQGYDAYRLAKRFNQHVSTHKKAPW